jgi:hypothetical protein
MPYVGWIMISDDTFFARSLNNLKEFADEYSSKIDIPFACLASPLILTEKNWNCL